MYLAQVILKLWVVLDKHHRCIDMWNWTEMPTVSCWFRAKTLWILLHMSREIYVGQKRGTICSHWNADYLLENPSANTKKMLPTRNSSILMMSSSEYLLLESECFFTKYFSSWPKTRYLYLRLPFLKMKEFRMILASLLFSLLWEIFV